VIATPRATPDGTHAGYVASAADITDLKRAEGVQRFLAEAGPALARSLDPDAALHTVAHLAVPALADWCTVDMVVPGAPLRRVALVHANPERLALTAEWDSQMSHDPATNPALAHVLDTGEPVLVPTLTDEMLRTAARDPEHYQRLRELGLRSTLAVPLVARGRTLGLITLLTAESGRQLGPADLALARDLADRCALAADNARLYQEARQALEAQALSLAQTDALLAAAPVAVAFLDRDLRYIRVNELMAAVNGVPAAGHPGRAFAEVLPDLADCYEGTLRRVLTTGEPLTGVPISYPVPGRPDGRGDWLANFYPARGPGGEVIGLGVMLADITEQKRAEEELKAADRRKDEFIAMLSHELRNPLAPVRTSLHILRQSHEPDQIAAVREMMERQVQHLVRLVDDLLDASRYQGGKVELRKSWVGLAAVVGRAVETARPQLDAARHELTVSLPEGPVELEADPVRLAQVLANLLHNAAKYTEPGGRIELTATLADRAGGPPEVAVSVRDTGIGIDADLLPRVFDLFMQADPSSTRAQGGLGIGLTLVKQLVELHGGRVEAHSAGPGTGSTFTVHLPTLRSEVGRRGAEDPWSSPPSTVHRPPPSRKVLIVEDNEDAARSLAMLLRLSGHEVATAADGTEALRLAAEWRPEAVFCDIGLPGLDGYGVAGALRRDPATAGAHLIAVTGYGRDEDRRRSRQAGFDHHLTKPVDPADLRGLLTTA
jgi:signal transduction histidine kinase/CheY-like chemotaxis protein